MSSPSWYVEEALGRALERIATRVDDGDFDAGEVMSDLERKWGLGDYWADFWEGWTND